MHSEGVQDLEKLYNGKLRIGTRLIKHDLPLLGYLPDMIDYPFYGMTFPLRKAMNKSQWASIVLGKKKASINDVWYNLFYYQFTKGYSLKDITSFKKILSKRIKK
jgi:hypothetical protein